MRKRKKVVDQTNTEKKVKKDNTSNLEVKQNQALSASMDNGYAGLLEKWCRKFDKAKKIEEEKARSMLDQEVGQQGEGSADQGFREERAERWKGALQQSEELKKLMYKWAAINKPPEDQGGQPKGEARQMKLGDWRNGRELEVLEQILNLGETAVSQELRQEVETRARYILEKNDAARSYLTSKEDTVIRSWALDVCIRKMHEMTESGEKRIDKAFKKISQFKDEDPEDSKIQTFGRLLEKLSSRSDKVDQSTNQFRARKAYLQLKRLAEEPLGLAEGPNPLTREELPETAKKLLGVWIELVHQNSAEDALTKKGWKVEEEGTDIRNELEWRRDDRNKWVERKSFILEKPELKAIVSSGDDKPGRLTVKEARNFNREQVKAAFNTKMAELAKRQVEVNAQVNAQKIATLEKQITDLQTEIEEATEIGGETDADQKALKDASKQLADLKGRHLKAADYYLKTGEQPVGYEYKMVVRLYGLESKRAEIAKRTEVVKQESEIDFTGEQESTADKEKSQIYLTGELDSIADMFALNRGALRRAVEQEEEGLLPAPESDEFEWVSSKKPEDPLLPETDRLHYLKDYRLGGGGRIIFLLHKDQETNDQTFYMTNEIQVLSRELGMNGSYLTEALSPKARQTLPKSWKCILDSDEFLK